MVYVSMTGMENFDNWAHGLTLRLLEAIVALKKKGVREESSLAAR